MLSTDNHKGNTLLNRDALYNTKYKCGRGEFLAKIDMFLKKAVEMGASDFHISTNSPPVYRILGEVKRLPYQNLTIDITKVLIGEIIPEQHREGFMRNGHIDFAYEIDGVGRFRTNVFRSHNGIDASFRVIPNKIPTLEELNLPQTLTRITQYHQGIVLITGPTGHGKTTTMASLINMINATRPHHIITIEQPVEYIFKSQKAVVNQREVGIHTRSFSNALRAALREDPDIIVVSEMRDLETISLALTAAETGHLVFGTMMTSNAIKTIDRIIDAFPADQQPQIRTSFSDALKCIISQRLIPRIDSKGRIPAVELLINTLPVANLIREGKSFQIGSMMITGKSQGMIRLDDSLAQLVKNRIISPESAYLYSQDIQVLKQLLGQ